MIRSNVSVATQFAGLQLQSCIYNASGPWCTTKKELMDIGQSAAGAIITKSCTLLAREGNPTPRYFENNLGSINSMGLPNKGYQYYQSIAEEITAKFQKPYIVSVSGLSLENNMRILESLQTQKNIAAIELNLSCPNVVGKAQTAYDFPQVVKVLRAIAPLNKIPIGIKLPPYFDFIHFQEMAAIINQYPIAFVTCVNSIGNGLLIDIEKEAVVIQPKGGFGGIGGDYIKPTALANVCKFRELLRADISVIGCGGIKTGQDVFEHLLCGADAVQIGTQFMSEKATCFKRIVNELQHLMQKKGYHSIADFKGKLIQA